jgi:hypothetical protein
MASTNMRRRVAFMVAILSRGQGDGTMMNGNWLVSAAVFDSYSPHAVLGKLIAPKMMAW